jgi:hypothetical protein
MPTYISMINWTGDPPPQPGDIRDAIEPQSCDLRARGMHSIVFLPDRGACAAVMIFSCRSDDDVAAIIDTILPEANARVDTMRFDDDPALPAWISRAVAPPSPAAELDAVYAAVLTMT